MLGEGIITEGYFDGNSREELMEENLMAVNG